MKQSQIIILILLTFVIGLVAGFDIGYNHASNKKMHHAYSHLRYRSIIKQKNHSNFEYVNLDPKTDLPISDPEFDYPTACTMEAKICPDGSSVGRQGPNCDFSPCPTN